MLWSVLRSFLGLAGQASCLHLCGYIRGMGERMLARLIIKNPQLKPGVTSSLKETGMKRCYPNLPDVEAIKKAA